MKVKSDYSASKRTSFFKEGGKSKLEKQMGITELELKNISELELQKRQLMQNMVLRKMANELKKNFERIGTSSFLSPNRQNAFNSL